MAIRSKEIGWSTESNLLYEIIVELNKLIGVTSASGGSSITLTTTGSSGAATLISNVLNIPVYSGGGGSETLDQVLTNGNTTALLINWDDVGGTGIYTTYLKPSDYGTNYPTFGTAAQFSTGYGQYNVNVSGRPNNVGLFWGYNGGFGNQDFTDEAGFGFRTETHFELGSTQLFEFHLPECITSSGVIWRPWSMYINKDTGVTNINAQITGLTLYDGISATPMFTIDNTNLLFAPVGDGSFNITSSTGSNSVSQAIGDGGLSFGFNGGNTPSVESFNFNAPIQVIQSATYGTSLGSAITARCTISGNFCYTATSSLTTDPLTAYFGDFATTGNVEAFYVRNNSSGNVTSMLRSYTGLNAYMLSDAAGFIWSMSYNGTSGTRDLNFTHDTIGAALTIQGTTGDATFGYNLRINGDFRPNDLPGTSGQVLTSSGANTPPTWTTLTTGTPNTVAIFNSSGDLASSAILQDDGSTLIVNGNTTVNGLLSGNSGSSGNVPITSFYESTSSSVFFNATDNTTGNDVNFIVSPTGRRNVTFQDSDGTVAYLTDIPAPPVDHSGTPTIVAGTGAGTSPTVSISTGSNETNFQINITTGTLPAGTGAVVATITFPVGFGSANFFPTISAANGTSALLSGATMVYIVGTSAATANLISGTSSLTAATAYKFNVNISR